MSNEYNGAPQMETPCFGPEKKILQRTSKSNEEVHKIKKQVE